MYPGCEHAWVNAQGCVVTPCPGSWTTPGRKHSFRCLLMWARQHPLPACFPRSVYSDLRKEVSFSLSLFLSLAFSLPAFLPRSLSPFQPACLFVNGLSKIGLWLKERDKSSRTSMKPGKGKEDCHFFLCTVSSLLPVNQRVLCWDSLEGKMGLIGIAPINDLLYSFFLWTDTKYRNNINQSWPSQMNGF